MRKIINSTYISLDGVIEEPHLWPPTGPDDERGGHDPDGAAAVLRRRPDGPAHLRGLRAGLADAVRRPLQRPHQHDAQVRRLVDAAGPRVDQHARSSPATPSSEIRRLKQAPGKDIVQYGFGGLSHALMEHGLLDELRLWVHPLFVGSGGPDDLIYRDAPTATFELRDTTPLASGTVILSYASEVMIARIWRGAVRAPDADEYAAYIGATGLAEYSGARQRRRLDAAPRARRSHGVRHLHALGVARRREGVRRRRLRDRRLLPRGRPLPRRARCHLRALRAWPAGPKIVADAESSEGWEGLARTHASSSSR